MAASGGCSIPLYLYQKKVLGTPMFYLSEHLELHREDYYARLQGISQRGDWDAWIAFFYRARNVDAKCAEGSSDAGPV